MDWHDWACPKYLKMINQKYVKALCSSATNHVSTNCTIVHTLWPPTIHHVPKYMCCYKATVVIPRRAYRFHDDIYIMFILLLWDLSVLCVVDHLWPLTYIYIYIYFMVAAPYIMYKTFQMCCYHQHACVLVCLSLPSAYLSVKLQWMIQVTRKIQSRPWIQEFWLCCK